MSVDNSATGRVRDLSVGGSGTGRAAVGVRSIPSSPGWIDSGRRANPVRESTDGSLERPEVAQDQAGREADAGHERKEIVRFEFHSLEALRAEWQRAR